MSFTLYYINKIYTHTLKIIVKYTLSVNFSFIIKRKSYMNCYNNNCIPLLNIMVDIKIIAHVKLYEIANILNKK